MFIQTPSGNIEIEFENDTVPLEMLFFWLQGLLII
jgi:hypothetical protein